MKDRTEFARFSSLARFVVSGVVISALAACQETVSLDDARAYHPIPQATLDLMAKKGVTELSPILIRAFKKEAELEVWKKGQDGRYVYLKTFPMCRWSGQLGPKVREGDRQVPEGFYTIGPGQMNPNSHYYLSFNVGYPNAYDRAHGDTGNDIMVHGICSSAGCFSMTNAQMDEIYALAREAFDGGERKIQLQSFPFRMTAQNMAKFRLDPNMPFWKEIKTGYDYFQVTHEAPKVGVCGSHYVFNKEPAAGGNLDPAAPCPALKDIDPAAAKLVAAKEQADNKTIAALVAQGAPAIRLVYLDGGQNPKFANVMEVSRPEALAHGPIEVPLTPAMARKLRLAALHQSKAPISEEKTVQLEAKAYQNAQEEVAELTEPKVSAPVQTAQKLKSKPASKKRHQPGVRVASRKPAKSPAPATVTAEVPQPSQKPFYSQWFALVSDQFFHPKAASPGAPTPLQ